MSECYYDAAGCLVCPEQAATSGVPAHVVTQAVIGWTAGANSIDVHDGDLHVVFDQPLNVVGVVLGLKGDRARVTVPSLIEHGWYFQHRGGLNLAQPIERGKVVGTVISNRQASDTFEIRRIGAQVSYLCNGAIVLVSPTRSTGPKLVNTCLYVSGDRVATGAAPSGGGSDPGGGPGGDVVAGSTDPANPTPLMADSTVVSIPDDSFAYFSIGVPPFGIAELDVSTSGGLPDTDVALYVGNTAATSPVGPPPAGVQKSDSGMADEQVIVASPAAGTYIISIYSFGLATGGITLNATLS